MYFQHTSLLHLHLFQHVTNAYKASAMGDLNHPRTGSFTLLSVLKCLTVAKCFNIILCLKSSGDIHDLYTSQETSSLHAVPCTQ